MNHYLVEDINLTFYPYKRIPKIKINGTFFDNYGIFDLNGIDIESILTLVDLDSIEFIEYKEHRIRKEEFLNLYVNNEVYQNYLFDKKVKENPEFAELYYKELLFNLNVINHIQYNTFKNDFLRNRVIKQKEELSSQKKQLLLQCATKIDEEYNHNNFKPNEDSFVEEETIFECFFRKLKSIKKKDKYDEFI